MGPKQKTFFYLTLGLVIFISTILQVNLFPFTVNAFEDFKSTKEFWAIIGITALSLWALYEGFSIKCKNPVILIFLGYILIHPFLTPVYSLMLFKQNLAGFWQYKPTLYAFLYGLFFCLLANLKTEKIHFKQFFSVLYWLALLTVCYVLLQYFNLDQFQNLGVWNEAKNTTNGTLVGTFTHPNYSGLFLAMALPACLYLGRWLMVPAIIGALILIDSKIPLVLAIFSIFYFLFMTKRKIFWVSLIVGIFLFIVLPFDLNWSDNGRFGLWALLIQGIQHSFVDTHSYAIFGYGFGTFSTLWYSLHTHMTEAHNEYLQTVFELGIVGGALLIFSIFWLLKRINPFKIADKEIVVLMACLLVSLIGAFGLFPWQIEPHRLITVILFALLHSTLQQTRGESK